MSRRLRVFLLADNLHPAFSVIDHIDAYVSCSRHEVIVINPVVNRLLPSFMFAFADVVAIHYSLLVLHKFYLPPRLRRAIRDFDGVKVQFIQDEYRTVYPMSEVSADLGVDMIFTLVRKDLVEKAYNHPRLAGVEKIGVLPGYVSDRLAKRPAVPVAQRKIDIGYRSRRLAYWLGDLAQEKIRIAEGVLRLAPRHGLACDISVEESQRVYGDDWITFLESCRCVLGTEGGSSIWDYDGSAEKAVQGYLRTRPGAPYEEVAREVLAPYEGNLMYNTMSPRVFEAAALRTPMVNFPGWYDGVVEADRHYIALEKDFSNFADVAAKIRNTDYLQAMADRSYDELVASGRYSKQSFMDRVDDAIDAAVLRRRAPAAVAVARAAGVANGPSQAKGVRDADRWAISSASVRRGLAVSQLASTPVLPLVLGWQLVTRLFSEVSRKDRTLREKAVSVGRLFQRVPYFAHVFTVLAFRSYLTGRRLRRQGEPGRSGQ